MCRETSTSTSTCRGPELHAASEAERDPAQYPVGDEGARQFAQGLVARSVALPADEQATELVVPGVGALDHPAARLPADAPEQRRFPTASDVRPDAAPANLALGIGVVVTLIETQMLRAAGATWAAQDDRAAYFRPCFHSVR